jgi:esterase/lipase superfamily enzyme
VARVRLGDASLDWDAVHADSLTDQRDNRLRLSVDSMEEFGVLHESMTFIDDRYNLPGMEEGQERFAQEINDRLERSGGGDIYIFVAQFKVDLDDALYIAAEFHHFMGREGVFLAYSWPTKEGILDYFSSAESAYATVRNLRELIRFLADETNAEKIHLLTYSAGARVVAYTVHSLRLMSYDLEPEEAAARYRLGQVIYTGPDLDARIFGRHYQDGMADIVDQITIYTTTRDKALAMSRKLYGRERLGSVDMSDIREEAFEYTRRQTRTNFVRVSEVEKIKEANSHGYFRHSPWVSSDVIMLLRHGLKPAQRGLVREPDDYRWDFPDDYPQQVQGVARLVEIPAGD